MATNTNVQMCPNVYLEFPEIFEKQSFWQLLCVIAQNTWPRSIRQSLDLSYATLHSEHVWKFVHISQFHLHVDVGLSQAKRLEQNLIICNLYSPQLSLVCLKYCPNWMNTKWSQVFLLNFEQFFAACNTRACPSQNGAGNEAFTSSYSHAAGSCTCTSHTLKLADCAATRRHSIQRNHWP